MMKNISPQQLNIKLSHFNGMSARFLDYSSSHSKLSIALSSPENLVANEIITLFFVEYIAGPTEWQNCKLQAEPFGDNEEKYKIYDIKSKFEAIGIGEININGEINCIHW